MSSQIFNQIWLWISIYWYSTSSVHNCICDHSIQLESELSACPKVLS